MNETLLNFGYPDSLIEEYEHWVVLLRPQQVTLGSLILGYKGDETAFSALPFDAMQALHQVIGDIENTLKETFEYKKINYLMLMMVDPHVHFHVLPRYAQPIRYEGMDFQDTGWPAAPDLSKDHPMSEAERSGLVSVLQSKWKPHRKI